MARLFGHRRQGDATTEGDAAPPRDQNCASCGADLSSDEAFGRYRVCGTCGRHYPVGARERVDLLVDPGTFKETLSNLYPTDPLGFVDRVPYSQRLREARQKTGLADAVVTGTCRIDGQAAVLVVLEFEFLGGSMGSVVGEKVAAACELAARRGEPLVAVTCSGGARMQEGMLALAQMAKTSAAVARLHSKGIPYVALFASPTTGGVYASFGTLADLILAEPGALVSFAGPRVAKALAGSAGEAPRTAEFLLEHGQIDGVVPRARSKQVIGEILRLASSGRLKVSGRTILPPADDRAPAAWAAVELARRSDRPTSMDYIRRMMSSFFEIRGDRATGDDPAVVCGLAELDGQALVAIALERGHENGVDRRGGHARPEGYRKAQRAMRLAAKWKLPILSFIDTPGADPGIESEAGGLGGAISHSMALMSQVAVPVLAAVIGEGGSGGALALGVADRVLMMENAIFSVIAPEGASAIIYRDPSHAPDVASSLKLTSRDLLELRLVDVIVSEPEGGAHQDPDRAALLLRRAIREELSALLGEPGSRLARKRYDRWRHVGKTTTAAAVAAERFAEQLETGVKEGASRLESGVKEGARQLGALSRKLPGRGE